MVQQTLQKRRSVEAQARTPSRGEVRVLEYYREEKG